LRIREIAHRERMTAMESNIRLFNRMHG
jgi:hypothetical protein